MKSKISVHDRETLASGIAALAEATLADLKSRWRVLYGKAHPMPEKSVKRRPQDCDAELADDDGPIFSTVAKLVEALKRSIPEGSENAERKKEALRLGSELLRGTKYEEP